MHLHPARIFLLLSIYVVLSTAWLSAQCPVITDSGLDQTEFEFCTGDVLTFTTEGTDLPAGDMIDWFISLTPNFNPYEGDGATVGTAPITADPCNVAPEILYLMINPDNVQVGSPDDRCDEFIIIYTGSGGFTPNDILVSNLAGLPGSDFWDDFIPGNLSTFNCGSTLNPTDPVPANSILVIQANVNNNVSVDLGPLCTSGLSVYIISYNAPASCIGGYLDNSSGGGCASCPVMLDIMGTCTYSTEMNYSPPASSINGWGVSNLLGPGVYANVVPAVTIPPYTPGGSVVSPFVWTIPADFCNTFPPGTYYVKGILNPAPTGGCAQIFTEEFEISISCPTAAISGDASICTQNCPDDPGQISLVFAGGSEPYLVDLLITATGFPPLSVTGQMFSAMETINICLGGAMPAYDPGTQTLTIPDAVAGNQISVEIISVEDAEGCSGSISPASVTIDLFESPIAIAGNDTTICVGSFVQLNGSIDGSAQSSQWITSGDGSIGNPFMPQTTYSPGATDVTAGTVTLTLIAMDAGNICDPDSSSIVVSIVQAPTANAGNDISVCEGESIQVNGAIGGSAVSSEWVTSGDGSFGNPLALQTAYTPGALDLADGTFVLTLIASGPGNACTPDSSSLIVNIFQNPLSDAGSDTTICSGSIVQLNGIVSGSASTQWITSGDGIFGDPFAPQTSYTSGVGDISNASVILTLIADGANGCEPDTSSITVSIVESPQAEAGSDQTICATDAAMLNGMISGSASSIWSSSGDGSFNDNSDPATSYIPGSADRTVGSVILYLTTDDAGGQCDPSVDSLVLTLVNPPVISGPSSGTVCAGEAGLLPHTVSGNIGSILWTTNGDGVFENPSSPSTFYTPGDQDTMLGMVVLTLLVAEATGACPLVVHPVTITILDCACPPITLTDPPSDLCNLDGTLDLSALVLIADPGTWQITMTPSGVSPATINGDTFNAVNADAGQYQLTFTLDNPMPGCPASANITIGVVDAPEYMAGPSQTVCSEGVVILNGSVVGMAGSIQWTTTGTGAFSDPLSLITQYIPGPEDIDSGFVVLILSGGDTAGVCPVDYDTMTVMFVDPPSALLTDSVMVCNDSAVGSVLDLTALISGAGSWQNLSGLPLDLNDPSAVDFNNAPPGYYTLEVTTASDPPCEDIVDTLIVQVVNCVCPQLVVSLLPEPICNASPNAGVNLNAFLTASQPGTWNLVSTPGGSAPAVLAGTFLNSEGADPGVYEVMFTFDVHVDGCPDSALLEVVVMDAPMAVAGTDTLICSDEVLQLNAVLNASATSIEWESGGDGTFSNISTLESIYTPGPVDISTGQVQIGIFAMDTTGVCATTEHTFVLTFQPAPFAELDSMSFVICNVQDSGSVVDLSSLIIAGDQSGAWADVDMSGVDLTDPSQVDFDGIAPGVYQFSYTTNSAMPPCDEASYLVSVEVEGCLCPDLSIPDPPAALCNNNVFDLNSLLSTPQNGSWLIVNFNNYPSPPVISGGELDLVDATPGTYRLDFVLADSVAGCPASAGLLFDLEGVPQLMVMEEICDFQDSTYSVLIVTDAMQLVNDVGDISSLGAGMFRIENVAFDQAITIMAFSGAGCSDEFYVEAPDCTCSIEVFDVPSMVSFCPMDSIEVIAVAEGAGIQSEYWLTPADTVFGPVVNVTVAGTFTFVVEASNGCRADTSFVAAQFPQIEATVEGFGPLCPGGNEGRIFVEDIVGATLPLMYSLNNAAFKSIDTFPWTILGLTAGVYVLTIRDANGCEISVEKILDDPAAKFLELGPDVEIAQGDSVFIDPDLNFIPNQFSYTPALLDTLGGWIKPVQSTLLVLEVTDLAGCIYADEMLITVEQAEASMEIFAPGIFSPNGDQINDTWTVFAADPLARIELLNIYNRWGGVLFSRTDFPVNDPSLGWDGTVNGEDMMPGVYVFLAKVALSDGQVLTFSGDITLIR